MGEMSEFLEVGTLTGGARLVRTTSLVRFRKTFGSEEPQDAVMIDYGSEKLFAHTSVDEVKDKVAGTIATIEVTAPAGVPVFLNVDAISSIEAATVILHHSNAKSVIEVGRSLQQAQEDVATVQSLIADALK